MISLISFFSNPLLINAFGHGDGEGDSHNKEKHKDDLRRIYEKDDSLNSYESSEQEDVKEEVEEVEEEGEEGEDDDPFDLRFLYKVLESQSKDQDLDKEGLLDKYSSNSAVSTVNAKKIFDQYRRAMGKGLEDKEFFKWLFEILDSVSHSLSSSIYHLKYHIRSLEVSEGLERTLEGESKGKTKQQIRSLFAKKKREKDIKRNLAQYLLILLKSAQRLASSKEHRGLAVAISGIYLLTSSASKALLREGAIRDREINKIRRDESPTDRRSVLSLSENLNSSRNAQNAASVGIDTYNLGKNFLEKSLAISVVINAVSIALSALSLARPIIHRAVSLNNVGINKAVGLIQARPVLRHSSDDNVKGNNTILAKDNDQYRQGVTRPTEISVFSIQQNILAIKQQYAVLFTMTTVTYAIFSFNNTRDKAYDQAEMGTHQSQSHTPNARVEDVSGGRGESNALLNNNLSSLPKA